MGFPGRPQAPHPRWPREAELLLRAGSGSALQGHGRGRAVTGQNRGLPGAKGSRRPLPSRPSRRPAASPGNGGTASAALLPLSLPYPSLSLPADGRAGSPRGCSGLAALAPGRCGPGFGARKGLRAGTDGPPSPEGPA